MPGRNVQTKSMIISLLGSFEGLQHNPQPQLSFDTRCKKVLDLSSQITPQEHFLPGSSSVVPCQISLIWESFPLYSSSCGTVRRFYHTLSSGNMCYMAFHPHRCFKYSPLSVSLWFSTSVLSSRFVKSFLRPGLIILDPQLRYMFVKYVFHCIVSCSIF